MIRVSLSRGNVLFSLGRENEAFAEWESAVAEAERFRNAELIAVSRIYLARGNLISQRVPANDILNQVTIESARIRKNKLFQAFSWQVRGLAHRALGTFNRAESAFMRSLDIHQKERHLENASYDWFMIASIRSLAGNFQGALQALQSSIQIDQRIENSWGIAASYRAMGDVYRRAERHEEAADAYARARRIYVVMGNEYEAAEIDRRIRNE
jgi:tetratricopeptide (TPR) repeat protein